MVTPIAPRRVNVVAAFFPLGGRNAGTPLLIASIPVSAAQPEVNARKSKKAKTRPVNSPSGTICQLELSARTCSPLEIRKNPQTNIEKIPSKNAYVGNARTVPDSLTPRKLIIVKKIIRPTANSTL